MFTTSPATAASSHVSRTTRRVLTVAGATAAAVVVWVAVSPVGGVVLDVRLNGAVQRVGLGAVVAASVLAGLAAWGVLALSERRSPRARRVWTVVVLVGLAVSLSGPIGAAAGVACALSLVGMHLVVAAVLLVGLGRR
jgi:hypothetical protein